uniref:Blastoderm-specific protein 25D n=2 Tax=Cacopsylla melanoneura TaxID=428564 RepID=A0A8D9BW17_9HEMI
MDSSSSCVLEAEEAFKQYEDELLLLFKNCDRNQIGQLNGTEFNELLNVLQLDASYKDQLLTVLGSNVSITFGQFKSSLLSIICAGTNELKREISPEREVSPKLVVGAKKYGRRSKPESIEEEEDDQAMAGSRQDGDKERRVMSPPSIKTTGTTSEDEFTRLNELHCAHTSFDEMFPQLNKRGSRDSPLGLMSPGALEVHGLVDNNIKAGYIHYDTLQELWESQGILNVANLMRLLGIEPGTETSIDQLSVLLEELRQSDSSNTQVLVASLCLAQLQNKLIKSHLEQLMFERDKLRTDVLHANKRASLIAAEIDENYTKIESSVQSQIKLVEDKHTETIRQLNNALNSERETVMMLTGKYETELSRYQETISQLTSEKQDKQKHLDKLTADYKTLLDETSLLERNTHNSKEQQAEIGRLQRKLQYLETTNESLLEFEQVVSTLRSENTMLRDRNDEMSVELENALRKCKQYCESGGACKRRTDDDLKDSIASSGGKLRKFNTEQDVSMPGLSMPECSPPLSVSSSPLSSKPLSAYYEESRQVPRNLQLELPPSCPSPDNPLLEPTDTEEEEHNYTTFIKSRSPLHSDSIELQFNTFQNEIQKLLHEKRQCDEENCKLKQENGALKTKLSQNINNQVENTETNVSDENKLKSSQQQQSPGTINLKSFAFDISLDSLTGNTSSRTSRNEQKASSNTMETCVNNNNNEVDVDVKMNTEHESSEDQFKTMTIHKEDDEHQVMETMILDKNGEELKLKQSSNDECDVDSLNGADEEMCIVKHSEPTNAEVVDSSVQNSDSCHVKTANDTKVSTAASEDGIITISKKPATGDDKKTDIKEWLNGVKNNSTKWTRETLEDCLKQPHPLWKLATLEAFLNEREELLNKCFYLETYVTKYDTMKADKDELEERCKDLTSCLEQMKVEFERLEDYWTGKMDDERKLFEQEQAVSTEKYIELELKINEYAELFSKADEDAEMLQTGFKSFSNKLPTIDETEMYEKQVVDLEEEFAEYRTSMMKQMREKDEMIRELNEALRQGQRDISSDATASPSPPSQPEVPHITISLLDSASTPPPSISTNQNASSSQTPPTEPSTTNEITSNQSPPLTLTSEMSPPTYSQVVLFNVNQNDWSCSSPSSPQVPLAPPTSKVDCCVQTTPAEARPLVQPPASLECAVQTEMFLEEIESLASKLDPERVSHYERVLNNQTSSPNNSVMETPPKIHKKMRRHKKNHQRNSGQTNNHVNSVQSRTPDLGLCGEEDALQLELRIHRQNVGRLAASDLLVKDLYVRNCMNMARIHSLEKELLVERSKNKEFLECN